MAEMLTGAEMTAEMPECARNDACAKSTRVEPGPSRTKAAIISTENAAETANLSLTSVTFVRFAGPEALAQ